MLQTALIEVRVFPWRPRARVMDAETVRGFMSDPTVLATGADDLAGAALGLVIGLGLWLLIIIAAPLIVLVLAVLLFSIELPIVLAVAVVLLVVRFAGIVPWTVVVLNTATGGESRESHRSILTAVRRVRTINADRRVRVRWAWS